MQLALASDAVAATAEVAAAMIDYLAEVLPDELAYFAAGAHSAWYPECGTCFQMHQLMRPAAAAAAAADGSAAEDAADAAEG